MKYAFRIRKSDLPLLTLLNGGVAPEVRSYPTYLVVDTENVKHNEILTQTAFDERFEVNANGPLVLKLKKAEKKASSS